VKKILSPEQITRGSDTISGTDRSAEMVLERMGGSLPPDHPIAVAAGLETLSGLTGFEKEGFSWSHCFPGLWVLAVLESGEGNVTCGGRKFRVAPGTFYIIPPGLTFGEHNTGDGAWKFCCLLLRFHTETVMGNMSRNSPVYFDGCFDLILKTTEVIRSLHFREPGFELKVLGGVLSILGNIVGKVDDRGDSSLSPAIAKAAGILRRHLNAPMDVCQLAHACNISVSLLSHRFKRETGFAPMEYLRRERIKAGKELILSGCTIDETAIRLGFKTAFHFSRIFHEIEGRPPIYFRQLSRRFQV